MASFKYQAISKNGARVNGVVEAYDELDAVSKIKQTCSVVVKVSAIKDESDSLLYKDVGGNKLNSKAFTVMCSQFSIILRSGIPIGRTVQLIAAKTTDKALHKLLTKVAEDVDAGRSLSGSFAARGEKLLPLTFIETIRAGEQSGNLDKAFETMYQHYDKQGKMKQKIRNALAYPSFVIVIAIAVVIVLMVKVVPTFTQVFADYGADLPGITKALIAISNFFRHYIIFILIIAAIIYLVYRIYKSTEDGRMRVAEWKMKLPVIGNITELTSASEFANTLTTLLGAGLPLTKAIRITAKTISNYSVSKKVEDMVMHIEEGQSLQESLKQADCMPDILVDMAAVGEQTGELEMTMHTIAGYYDSELDNAITKALNKLEPATLIFIAGIAGFIVLAVYIAMFQMYSVM